MPKINAPSPREKETSKEERETNPALGTGWGKVAAKKAQNEEAAKGNYNSIYLRDGESAVLQFLDDEPFCFEGHKSKRWNWAIKMCQLVKQKHCLMCDADIKPQWQAAWRVLDYRGTWEKGKTKGEGKFKNDKPVERVLIVSNTVANQIHGLKDRYGKELTQLVLEMSRTGSSAKDTSYNFERAVDRDDSIRKPIAHKTELAHLRELIKPPSDNELIALGINRGVREEMEQEETNF